MKTALNILSGVVIGMMLSACVITVVKRDWERIEKIWKETPQHSLTNCKDIIAIGRSVKKPDHVTNIVNNGLDSWLADTNHTFGPKFAKRIFVMQLPTGKWHIRYRDETITNFVALFNSDQAFDSADEARQALTINMDLQIKKAVSDAMENAFK